MKRVPESVIPKISVIIPVYNAERWLQRCLDAVCRQTLQDIEIICVNDGSTDNSEKILSKYAEKDCRIKPITLPSNLGASTARNRGMDAARGEYLGFVDSDDYPVLDFYEKLYTAARENDADVAKGNYRYWGGDGKSLPVDYILNEHIRVHKTNFSFAFCSAIYRRKLVAEHTVRFPEGLIDIEDPIFTLKIALLCNRIALVENAEINIAMHEDSATFGAPSIKRIFEKFKGLSKIIDIVNENDLLASSSYAFITAFWFKSVVETSLQNKTEQAFKVIVDSLYDIFTKVRFHEDCAIAFEKIYSADLFAVMATGKITKLAAYIIKFYDKKTFAINYLMLQSQRKKEMRAGEASVAIPICANQPSLMEAASLRQCLNILGTHQIVLFGPESLDISTYERICREHGVKYDFEAFPDGYFESPITYSKLLLDINFYSRFICSEYLLVHQLDSWVFRDELACWCRKGYDYIGAPWFDGYSKAADDSVFIEPSGNGGFSLRNIRSFIECLRTLQTKMIADEIYVEAFDEIIGIKHEDSILVRLFPEINPAFKIAPVKEAMHFSFEVLPERLYTLTGNLPFGCHGFAKYNPAFWSQYIAFPNTILSTDFCKSAVTS